VLALESSIEGRHRIYNLGSGAGFSVREVISACARVTGLPIAVEDAPRRAGDPAVLVASSDRAIAELGWRPEHTDLDEIVADAWAYLQELGDRSHAARR
jgi:UDP-glucose 4-epimerase